MVSKRENVFSKMKNAFKGRKPEEKQFDQRSSEDRMMDGMTAAKPKETAYGALIKKMYDDLKSPPKSSLSPEMKQKLDAINNEWKEDKNRSSNIAQNLSEQGVARSKAEKGSPTKPPRAVGDKKTLNDMHIERLNSPEGLRYRAYKDALTGLRNQTIGREKTPLEEKAMQNLQDMIDKKTRQTNPRPQDKFVAAFQQSGLNNGAMRQEVEQKSQTPPPKPKRLIQNKLEQIQQPVAETPKQETKRQRNTKRAMEMAENQPGQPERPASPNMSQFNWPAPPSTSSPDSLSAKFEYDIEPEEQQPAKGYRRSQSFDSGLGSQPPSPPSSRRSSIDEGKEGAMLKSDSGLSLSSLGSENIDVGETGKRETTAKPPAGQTPVQEIGIVGPR